MGLELSTVQEELTECEIAPLQHTTMLSLLFRPQDLVFTLQSRGVTLNARGFFLLERRNTAKRREKPLVQAFENLTSMLRLIDIEKTSNLMCDITYQSASLVPTVHSSYLL